MEIVIIWLLFGITSSIIGSQKGRSGCGWFITGFLLGPFGLILALASPKKTKNLESITIHKDDNKKCPYCAELIKKDAIVCRYCGRDLEINNRKSISDQELDNYVSKRYLKEGIDLYKEKKFKKAISKFTDALLRNEKNKYAFYYRALAYNALHDKDRVISNLKKAARLKHKKAKLILEKKNIEY